MLQILIKGGFNVCNFSHWFIGLAIRKISDVCLPAFLSSLHGVRNLVYRILPNANMDNKVTLHLHIEALDSWKTINNGEIKINTEKLGCNKLEKNRV